MGNQCSSIGLCSKAEEEEDNAGLPILTPDPRPKNKEKTLNAGANELFKSGEIRLKRKILEADMINDVKGRGDYLNILDDHKEHEERLVTLRDRRMSKKVQERAGNNNDDYLKNFEGVEDPLESNKNNRLSKTILGSAVKSKRYVSQQMQNSFQNKNLSTNSGNLSILSAALAMSSSQNLSSRMSSRLSMQSKKRLVALHAVDKKNQYNNLYKDIKINKAKIQKDLQWLNDKFEHLSINDPDLADKKISRADFYVYGGSLVAH